MYYKDKKQEEIAVEIGRKLKEAGIIQSYKIEEGCSTLKRKKYRVILYMDDEITEKVKEAIEKEYTGFTDIEAGNFAVKINITKKGSIEEIIRGE